MAAVEWNDATTGKPDIAVKRMQSRALEHGLMQRAVASAARWRFLEPLTIPDAQFDQAWNGYPRR